MQCLGYQGRPVFPFGEAKQRGLLSIAASNSTILVHSSLGPRKYGTRRIVSSRLRYGCEVDTCGQYVLVCAVMSTPPPPLRPNARVVTRTWYRPQPLSLGTGTVPRLFFLVYFIFYLYRCNHLTGESTRGRQGDVGTRKRRREGWQPAWRGR